MYSSSKLAALSGAVVAVFLNVQSVSAQGTNATCLPQYSWMDNSRGQSPCLMAAYLNSACLADPTDAYVYSLPEDFHYRPPTVEFATPCQCSTVFYSMIGACATCQDRSNLPWSGWQTNCSTDYVSVWPSSIPSGTSIPQWAYLDVRTSDAFNVSAAQANAAQDPPESTATAGPTASSQSVGFSSAAATSLATGTDSAVGAGGTGTAAASNKKSSHTGAIVGGVVGGVGGAAILAGIIAFFVIRHRRQSGTAPSAAYTGAAHSDGPAAGEFAHHDMGASYAEKPVYDATPYTPTTFHETVAMPVYNPNDPATFPPTSTSPSIPGSTTVYNPSLNAGYAGSNPGAGYVPTSMTLPPGQQPFSHQPGGYSGVAEV